MKPTFVYHAYSKNYKLISQDKQHPIIFSIYSIRQFFPTSDIFVIDKTPEKHDWEGFDKTLNFEIICDLPSWNIDRMTGKVLDIQYWLKTNPVDWLVYLDSDIIWMKDAITASDLFKTDFEKKKDVYWANSGYYNFLSNSKGNEFFDFWCNNIKNIDKNLKSINDYIYLLNPNYKRITDETMLCYSIGKFNNKNYLEKQTDVTLINEKFSGSYNNALHLLGLFIPNKNKKFFITKYKELYDVVKSSGIEPNKKLISLNNYKPTLL